MEWLGNWIEQIILVLFIAMIIDLLLPNHSLERYVKLVVGLLILMTILQPILHLFLGDWKLDQLAQVFDENQFGTGQSLAQIQEQSKLLTQAQQEEIRKQLEKGMKTWIEKQIPHRFPVEVESLHIQMKQGADQVPEVSQVQLTVRPKKEKSGESPTVMEPVQPVNIDLSSPEEQAKPASASTSSLTKKIEAYLEDVWQLLPEQVHVEIQPG